MQKRARQNQLMRRLFLTLGVLVIVLIVVLILMLATGGPKDIEEQKAQLKETGRYIEGVSIAGVDISGMTYAEAGSNSVIAKKTQEVVNSFTYVFTIAGKEYSYTAQELGITTNLSEILEEALYFGHIGDGATIRDQQREARESGVDFAVSLYADREAVLIKLKEYKPKLDMMPQDATLKIADDVLGEARFTYIDEVKGVDVDVAQLASLISANINKGNFSAAEAPVIITNPKIDVETLKANTRLIGTYTSEFSGGTLDNHNRVANIEILAGIINGTIIRPGEVWSINDAAGPRDAQTAKTVGWKEAPGIADGRYRNEVGGGVCQVSSTLYNASIRAEIEIVDRSPHSWPSSYVPKGMDATISTGGPDLKLSNPYDMPVYIAAYINKDKKKLTVEIFGPPLSHGYIVEFTTIQVGSTIAGETIYHYNKTQLPDGTPIAEGGSETWKQSRDGQTWEVYKQYMDKKGNIISSKLFTTNRYSAFTGEVYVNGPDPAALTPAE
ncbi:MAG: VanW family protein [Christensenellales bacterium]|jgi:vancomycin resistance protein YoaR